MKNSVNMFMRLSSSPSTRQNVARSTVEFVRQVTGMSDETMIIFVSFHDRIQFTNGHIYIRTQCQHSVDRECRQEYRESCSVQEVQECTTLQPVCNTVYQTVCTDSAGYSVPSAGYSGPIKRDIVPSGYSGRIKRDNAPFTAFGTVSTGHHDDLTAPVTADSALYSVPQTDYGTQSCQQVPHEHL